MARDEAPPFARGNTFYNGSPIDTANLGGVNYEGKIWRFEQNSPDNNMADDGSGRYVLCKAVRNVSAINLKPGRVVHYKGEDPFEGHIDGYCHVLAERPAGVVDEFLPPAGVVPNDLFWMVVSGPTKVTQPHAGASTFVYGDRMVPAVTGATIVDDLAGRVALQDLTGATATLGGNIQNQLGFVCAADAGTIDKLLPALVRLLTA